MLSTKRLLLNAEVQYPNYDEEGLSVFTSCLASSAIEEIRGRVIRAAEESRKGDREEEGRQVTALR